MTLLNDTNPGSETGSLNTVAVFQNLPFSVFVALDPMRLTGSLSGMPVYKASVHITTMKPRSTTTCPFLNSLLHVKEGGHKRMAQPTLWPMQ